MSIEKSNKVEIINYYIDKLNDNIDLSDILDGNGDTIYTDNNPFVPIIYVNRGDGNYTTTPETDIIREQEESKRYIEVSFVGESLQKENILKVGDYPIESWIGIVDISFLINIESEEEYSKIYAKIEDFQEEFLLNKTEIINIYGAERSISVSSRAVLDINNSINTTNSNDYKTCFIKVNTSVTNKGIVRGKDKKYKVDGKLQTLIDKDYAQDKNMVDNSTTNNTRTKSIPDSVTENIVMMVVLDYDNPFIKKVYDEILDDGTQGKIAQTFEIETIYEVPTKPGEQVVSFGPTRDYYLEGLKETISDASPILLTLNFREV